MSADLGGMFECESCGYQPDHDALIHGLNNGYCPKCGEEWRDDDNELEALLDDDDETDSDDAETCFQCGSPCDAGDEYCEECYWL